MSENKKEFPGFIGPDNQMRSQRYDCQATINFYLEASPYGDAKEQEAFVMIGTPGLELQQTIGTGPIRALYVPSNNYALMIIVSGSEVYTMTYSAGNTSSITKIGNLLTSTGLVSISDNGLSAFIVDGSYGYYIANTNTIPSVASPLTVVQSTDPNFYQSSYVSFQDGYFILNQVGTEYFFLSSPYSTSFYALNEANKSGEPDNIVAAVSNNRELYLFGTRTTEIWWDSGNSGVTPCQRPDGKFINFGCTAPQTVRKLDNTIFWLGRHENGTGIVFMLQGEQAVRISTHAIEYLLNQSGNLSTSTAYAYQEEGHFFYVLNPSGLNTTLVYDVMTQTWHERKSFNPATNLQDRHLANTHALFGSQHIVGDYQNGNVYLSSLEVYQDNGAPITRIRQSPHVSSNLNNVFYKLLEIDFQFGVGLNGNTFVPGDGTNPVAVLQISNDGGQTWGNELQRDIGPIGAYRTRARWQRLGYSRDRVFRLIITDPVPVTVLSAKLDLEQGTA
jgi:hypothetical protein